VLDSIVKIGTELHVILEVRAVYIGTADGYY